MGQEQIGNIFADNNNQQGQGHLGNSRRKNIFAGTPVQSEVGNNNGSRVRQADRAEALTPRSQMTPVRQYQQDEVKSQHRSRMQHSEVVAVGLQNLGGDQPYEEMPPAERYPTRLTYFNAWSLPIQKYYLQERGPYQGEEQEEEQIVEMKQPRQMKQFDAGELEGLMAERMKEELATAQRNKRRQNLNMV